MVDSGSSSAMAKTAHFTLSNCADKALRQTCGGFISTAQEAVSGVCVMKN
jgi:hypothetical protein